MAIVGFVATTIADLEVINWAYVGIATLGFTVIYVAKNFFMPSDSDPGTINWRDLVSGLIVAMGMAISSFAASIITLGFIDWKALGLAVLYAVIGYFGKTIPSPQSKKK